MKPISYTITINKQFSWFCLGILLFLFSCAPSRLVQPLKKGEYNASFNVGGPLIGYSNTVIPIPLSSISIAKGISDSVSAWGSLHTTALLFGTGQVDFGVLKGLIPQKGYKPAISASVGANLALDFHQYNFRFWPQADINAYWNWGRNRNLFYLGICNWIELRMKRSHDQQQFVHWIMNPQIGVRLFQKKWSYGIEWKYLAPTIQRLPNVIDYKGFGSTGANGIFLSISKTF